MTTYSKLTYHVVFGTKHRVKSIREQIQGTALSVYRRSYSEPVWAL